MTRTAIFIVGTRAQVVKLAPVLRVAVDRGLPHRVLFTGQHRESIDDLVDDFGLESAIDKPDVSQERSTIFSLLGWTPAALVRCIRYLRDLRAQGKPPIAIVHGDTMSTLVGAVAARLAGAPLVHVESGLSSGRMLDPFPEELIRRMVFRFTDLAICPNDDAFERMRRRPSVRSVHTGENTLLDSVRFAVSRVPGLDDLPSRFFLASIHRFGNIYSRRRLGLVVEQLMELGGIAPVLFVLHPATEKRLREYGFWTRLASDGGIRLMPRLPYTEFLALLSRAELVVTDGGSNQEELSYLGVPAVLMRETTERPDGLGKNVVFERDIGPGLASFVAGGGCQKLRRDPLVDSDVQPSESTVDAIQRLLAG